MTSSKVFVKLVCSARRLLYSLYNAFNSNFDVIRLFSKSFCLYNVFFKINLSFLYCFNCKVNVDKREVSRIESSVYVYICIV